MLSPRIGRWQFYLIILIPLEGWWYYKVYRMERVEFYSREDINRVSAELSQLDVFRGLSQQQLLAVLKNLYKQSFKRYENLYTENGEAKYIHVVKTGSVLVIELQPKSRQFIRTTYQGAQCQTPISVSAAPPKRTQGTRD